MILLGTLASLLLTLAWAGLATADVVYLYDDLGRLVRVIREDGEAATYHYDAIGNLLRITRESGVPQTATVTGISTSTLQQNSSTTLTLTGFNLSGAAVSASAGITVTAVQSDAGTLTIQVSVGDAAPLGSASLAIQTAFGITTVPLTIIPVLATSIQLSIPFGVAVDGRGNLFIADTGHNRVRKVGPDGAIITVAGDGTAGFGGDGGPATSARLNFPTDMAVDIHGNLFIADANNHRIRRVSPDGIITTVAGDGTQGFGGDGGPAISAQLNTPFGVAVDEQGNLFIGDRHNHRVRKVTTDGIITTVAGTGAFGFSGDGGPATSAQLNFATDVAVGGPGMLFIVDEDNNRIRRVSPDGIITTVAGSGVEGFGGDGGLAISARLDEPHSVVVDAAGNLYIADTDNHRIRRVSPDGIITTVAGDGTAEFSGDGGLATSARLNLPAGVAVDEQGNLFIADHDNHRIRKVSSDDIIITVAGSEP